MHAHLLCYISAAAALAAICSARDLPREFTNAALNLDFSQGQTGSAPPGWHLGPESYMPPHAPVYVVETASGSACRVGPQCATVRSLRLDNSIRSSFLYQVIDAAPNRSKWAIFRASVRVEAATPGSMAGLLVRVHNTSGGTSYRDDMSAHPITSASWSDYQIVAPIADDARDLEFGIQLFGQGQAWIDQISMQYVFSPDEANIREVIRKFADARNAHDGAAAADLYADDGRWIGDSGDVVWRGHAELAKNWGSAPGRVTRSIRGVQLLSPDIAIVAVHCKADISGYEFAETFVLVKTGGGWKIQLHQPLSSGSQ